MKSRLEKLMVICMLGLILFTGCNDKTDEVPNDNVDSDIIDNDNNANRTWMVSLTGYLVADDQYKNRYYGFDNESGEKITKEINIDNTIYKFDVEMTTINNKLEYKVYFNNKLLDTIGFEPDFPEYKNIDLFVLDGYAIVGYNHSYVNIYDLNNYKLIDNFAILNELVGIENKFVLTANSLSFIDVSGCPVEKVIIEVKNNDVKISRQSMTRDELDKYEISGGAC